MTLLPRGVKVHLAFGFIDMRKGIDGLAMLSRVSCASAMPPTFGHHVGLVLAWIKVLLCLSLGSTVLVHPAFRLAS